MEIVIPACTSMKLNEVLVCLFLMLLANLEAQNDEEASEIGV